jgi:DNA-binding beta-propeller fold protein YncE
MLTLACGPGALAAVHTPAVFAVGGGGLYPIGSIGNPMDLSVRIAGQPAAVAVSPDANTAYVAGGASGQLTVVDLGRDAVTGVINVGGDLDGVALSPDGTVAYVERPGALIAVDLRTRAVGQPIPVAVSAPNFLTGETGIAVSPSGRMAYVSDQADDTVIPIDLRAGVALAGIPVPPTPDGIAIAPDGLTAYVATAGDGGGSTSGALTPINLTSGVAETPVTLPYSATNQVAIAGDASTAYVTSQSGVIAVDLSSGRLRQVIAPQGATLNGPFSAITIDASQTTAYAVAPCVDLQVSCFSGVFAFNLDDDTSHLLYAGIPFDTLTGLATPPGPHAAVQSSGGRAGSPIRFTTTGSANPGGQITSYQWSFGDHKSQRTTRPSITHVYGRAGRFTVTLTTRDRSGCAARLIFTGQTATCSGQRHATATRTIAVAHAKWRPKRRHKARQPRRPAPQP